MKTKYKILLGLLILLIGFRIYLPHLVTDYINKVLKDIPGHTGSITDVDLQIYKGAYSIDSLEILKLASNDFVPFFKTDKIDLSIQWGAIFDGAIVGEIDFISPELNFLAAEDTTNAQYGSDVDWTKPVKALLPIKINRFGINDGTIHFRNFTTEPKVDIYLKDIGLVASNLSNSESIDKILPSELHATATSIGGGKVSLDGSLNLLKEIPDVDLNFNFESANLPAFNDFLRAYANIDAEEGSLNIYSELVIKDAQVSGYVKPLINDLKIVSWKEDSKNLINLAWQAITGVVAEIFENQKKDQFATRAPLTGDLSAPETKVWPVIWNILSNAFVDAFKKTTDETVDFANVNQSDGE